MPMQEHHRYLVRIDRQLSVNVILHYDAESNDLRAWFWPVDDVGHRVTPSGLSGYRETHEFKAPCCLCAAETTAIANYTETVIYIAADAGPYHGSYVAGCAFNRCGYLSE